MADEITITVKARIESRTESNRVTPAEKERLRRNVWDRIHNTLREGIEFNTYDTAIDSDSAEIEITFS